MTAEEKLAYLKKMSVHEKDENVLASFLALAEEKATTKVFPFGEPKNAAAVMHRYDKVICEIAVYLVNKRGAEGEKSHTESTAERVYENGGVPDSIMNKLTPFCGAIR